MCQIIEVEYGILIQWKREFESFMRVLFIDQNP